VASALALPRAASARPTRQPAEHTSSELNEDSHEDAVAAMSISFVTRKLRTQTLVEAEKDSAADDDDVDEANTDPEDAAKVKQ
jgi:hypothetical protein